MSEEIKKDGIQKIDDEDLNVSGGWSWPWGKKEEEVAPIVPDTTAPVDTPNVPTTPVLPTPNPAPVPKPKNVPKPKPNFKPKPKPKPKKKR